MFTSIAEIQTYISSEDSDQVVQMRTLNTHLAVFSMLSYWLVG